MNFYRFLFNVIMLLAPALTFATTKVAIVGDSISNGYGVLPGQCYVDLLQQHYISEQRDIVVINRSFNGATTKDGVIPVIDLLTEEKPDYLVIFLGINDSGLNIPLVDLQNNFVAMVQKGTTNCQRVVLCGVDAQSAYNQILAYVYVYLINTYNVYPVMLLNSTVIATNPGGHPSAAGHILMESYLYTALQNCGIP